MTIEEAIKYLDIHAMNQDYNLEHDNVYEAIEIAIEALNKQLPRMPIYKTFKTGGVVPYECPTCHKHNIDDGKLFGEHCPYCGQKFDWRAGGND